MKKILQFTVAETKGGRTQYILNLWDKINHEKFLFDFVTFSDELDFEDRLTDEGCNVYHIKNYPEKKRKGFIVEFSKILENGYDVIEIHTSYWKDTIVEELAKKAGIRKIIIHGHSTGITQITVKNREGEARLIRAHNKVKKRINQNMATDFWACSEECAKWLYLPSISKEKIRIVPNTIDTDRFRFNPKVRVEARKNIEWDDYYIFGFVGRIEPAKNLRFLIDVFYKAWIGDKRIRLIIVGDGSERSMLETYVQELEMEKNIIFTGQRDDPYYYYQMMDCFVLPSCFEGFPLVALEAQCSGLKCIVSENVPKTTCVTDKVWRIPIIDQDRWVSEMLCAVKPYDRRDCSDILIERGFDTKTQIGEMERLYCV